MEHYFTNNDSLKSELRIIHYTYKNEDFNFYSDNGVFAKNKIDFGSRLLIETILDNVERPSTFLDVGCGYGFMGIVFSKITGAKGVLVDINKRAVHLTKMNIKENKVDCETLVSNVYENIKEKYEIIISNPPIRAGKEVVLEILNKAKNYLTKDGVLWFVIRKDQGAKSIKKELEKTYEIEIVKKDKGFYIMKAKIS